ncbi:MAG: hypothetical protein WKF84_08555 [Pyrinomonadaceae bacterium]
MQRRDPIRKGTKHRKVRTLVYRKTGAEDVTLHHRNLHNAIRKGEALRCDAMLGYYGVVVTTMGVDSFRKQKYLKWNSKRREKRRGIGQ